MAKIAKLTDEEKLIWAAVYACQWSEEARRSAASTHYTMDVGICIVKANIAICNARESHHGIREDYEADVHMMMAQMVSEL